MGSDYTHAREEKRKKGCDGCDIAYICIYISRLQVGTPFKQGCDGCYKGVTSFFREMSHPCHTRYTLQKGCTALCLSAMSHPYTLFLIFSHARVRV